MIQERQVNSRFSKTIFLGLSIYLGFVVLDGILLSLLPILGISYGEVFSTLTALSIFRGGLYFVWLIVFAALAGIKKGILPRHSYRLLFGFNVLLLVLVIDGFYIEPMQLSVSRIELQVPGLSHPVRIVQLSDIHVERTTRRELAIPGAIEALKPDLIVMTGDYLNESYSQKLESAQDLRSLISQFHAPLGIYAVNGNVETSAEMNEYFEGMDVQTLENEVIRLPQIDDHFVLMGLSFTNLYYDQKNLARLMTKTRPDDFTILLYHKPDLAYAAQDLEVKLYLAGHTHGGQVRLPVYGALFTNSRYGKTFEMGLYHLGQTRLFVSRGIGLVGGNGPRARFLCQPEIVVFDLIPANP